VDIDICIQLSTVLAGQVNNNNNDELNGGREKKEKRREKVNDYSGTIVSERRRWRTHTLGPIIWLIWVVKYLKSKLPCPLSVVLGDKCQVLYNFGNLINSNKKRHFLEKNSYFRPQKVLGTEISYFLSIIDIIY
jgi:hypothetical protein